MASLMDLSKVQLIELIVNYTETIDKQLKVIQYLVKQIQENPQAPRGTIQRPIKEMSLADANAEQMKCAIDYIQAVNSSNPELLFEFMKSQSSTDIFTI